MLLDTLLVSICKAANQVEPLIFIAVDWGKDSRH